jgi:hypothetical protein
VLIGMKLASGEQEWVSLLNWLARSNARLLRGRPDLPGLYESRVRYEREDVETWCDYLSMLAQGWEDCDGLAAARAGELLARGWRALHPGEGGYALARKLKPSSIAAEVVLTTRVLPGDHGLYHCIDRYEIDGRVFWDDPSARLGMLERRLTPEETQARIVSRVRLAGDVVRPRDPRRRPHPAPLRRHRRRLETR